MGSWLSATNIDVTKLAQDGEELENDLWYAFDIFGTTKGTIAKEDLKKFMKLMGVVETDDQFQELYDEKSKKEGEERGSSDKKEAEVDFELFQKMIVSTRKSTDLRFELYDCIEFLNVTRRDCEVKSKMSMACADDIVWESLKHVTAAEDPFQKIWTQVENDLQIANGWAFGRENRENQDISIDSFVDAVLLKE